jgi:hypothetical protein
MYYTKPKRNIHTFYIHCSASDNPEHDHIDVIRQWHLERGFSDVGYHDFIGKKHDLQHGRSLEKTPAAQKGYNTGSGAVCLSGLEHFTERQFHILRRYCMEVDQAHGGMVFKGHNEVSNKTCPNFDFKGVLGLNGQGRLIASKPVIINTRKETVWQKFSNWLRSKENEVS